MDTLLEKLDFFAKHELDNPETLKAYIKLFGKRGEVNCSSDIIGIQEIGDESGIFGKYYPSSDFNHAGRIQSVKLDTDATFFIFIHNEFEESDNASECQVILPCC